MNRELKEHEACQEMLDYVGRFLTKIGWKPLVAGGLRIEQGDKQYNFNLIIPFTGKPPKKKKIPDDSGKAGA